MGLVGETRAINPGICLRVSSSTADVMDSAGSAFGVVVPVDILTVGAHMGDEIAWAMALAAHRRQGGVAASAWRLIAAQGG